MAGMLPGVEAARRRRFHKTNNPNDNYRCEQFAATSSRRSSFCLYATSHDHYSNSTTMRNPSIRHESRIMCDESRLGAAAREAKKRLDERLQPQWLSKDNRRDLTYWKNRSNNIQSNVQPEVPNLKKSGLKRLGWLKLSWRSSEQELCAVCFERLWASPGETQMQLPCAHRFHTICLVPWLEAKPHCPCCRL